jgi:hypothetical protein
VVLLPGEVLSEKAQGMGPRKGTAGKGLRWERHAEEKLLVKGS